MSIYILFNYISTKCSLSAVVFYNICILLMCLCLGKILIMTFHFFINIVHYCLITYAMLVCPCHTPDLSKMTHIHTIATYSHSMRQQLEKQACDQRVAG